MLHARTHPDGDRTSLLRGSEREAPLTQLVTPETTTQGEQGRGVVVLVGPMEHHSNLLVWREAEATVVEIRANAAGHVDRGHLAEQLAKYRSARMLIGSFSAASNLTGVMECVDEVTKLLHEHGALAFWDYAAAAPHVEIDMNPVSVGAGVDSALLAKDAVFISPHKFPGGPGTPGVKLLKSTPFLALKPLCPVFGGARSSLPFF